VNLIDPLQLNKYFARLSALDLSDELQGTAEFAALLQVKKASFVDRHEKPFRNAADYVLKRDQFFGSTSAYRLFSDEADAELLQNKLGGELPDEFKGHPEAQMIFYRWVRRAYLNSYPTANVPQFIKSQQMGPKLVAAINAAGVTVKKKHLYQGDDDLGGVSGFNPRPKNSTRGYRLGTLSLHGLGLAIDVDDKKNPQISILDWSFIEHVAGKSSTQPARVTLWRDDPEQLYKYVSALSSAFVTELAKKSKAAAEAKAAAAEKVAGARVPASGAAAPVASSTDAKPPATAVTDAQIKEARAALLAGHKHLEKYAETGFFSLKKELVLAMREAGLVWGATFGQDSAIDLMHFELDPDKRPLPAWSPDDDDDQ
jgi:hypothetical protein